MDTRLLARGLRARPTSWLVNTYQQSGAIQPMLHQTLRYNSNSSSRNPSRPPPRTATQKTSQEIPSSRSSQPTEQKPTQSAPKESISDFDKILDNLDLGGRAAPTDRLLSNKRNLSQSVKEGSKHPSRAADSGLGNRKTELKLGPTLGRQVLVEPDRGVDLPIAIRRLQTVLRDNAVRKMVFAQRFHVRRGAKKKQLRRERWRRLFKFSFRETVKKIQRMQNQGW